jgi:phosphatidylserine decarboxylase
MWRLGFNTFLRRKIIYSRRSRHTLENERNTMIIEGRVPVCTIQIADSYVDKIECWVEENQEIKKGQRIGRIRMGSQVDLVVPALEGMAIVVQEGQHVKAGESVLLVRDSE